MTLSNNEKNLSRRRFLQWSQAAMGAVGATPFLGGAARALGATTAAPAHAASHVDYYEKLGVTKIINAAGTLTVYTGSIEAPIVQQAATEAAKHPVHLVDLQRKAGAYIASKVQCDDALVSCGCCSALTLAAAACMQAANNCSPRDIPQNASKMKNEVIIQRSHRADYNHSMYSAGIKFVEVTGLDEYKAAFGPNTIQAHYLNSYPSQVSHEDWLSVAHSHGIPCSVDVAAEIPPISNLWNFTKMGFDLVCFSGGKGMRGPQNAGLLLGRKDLINFAHANNNPNESVGRNMKVAKEQIVGMVAAVDWILEQTDEKLQKEYTDRINVVLRHLKGIPTLESTISMPPLADHSPTVHITYDASVVGVRAADVRTKLRALNPCIELGGAGGGGRPGTPNANRDQISLSTWTLQPGEDEIVGRELRKALTVPKKKA